MRTCVFALVALVAIATSPPATNPAAPVRIAPGEFFTLANVTLGALPDLQIDSSKLET